MKEVKRQVETILKNFPASRNSDKLLEVLVLENYYNVHGIEDILKNEVPSIESIRRSRQYFQEHGLYLSTKQVKEHRTEMEAEYLTAFYR